MQRILYWFRNDLRLTDNPALDDAVRAAEEIVPVYVLDERYLKRDRWGFLRTGPYRLQFLLESLANLKDFLEEKGSKLLIRRGIPEEVLPQLAEEYGCEAIYGTKEYTHEELKVEDALSGQIQTEWRHGSLLLDPDDLPFSMDQLPDVFTAFRKKVERYSPVREVIEAPAAIRSPELAAEPVPSLEDLGFTSLPVDKRSAFRFKGGALAAYERLEDYLWGTNAVATYKETRNGLIGRDYSTKFSPWLANGSISPRAIYHEVEAYEAEVTKNKSTYWVKFELLWREYFKYVAMRYGRRIFLPGGIQDKNVRWKDNPKSFQRWIMGATGDRFVDANMRELLLTGWMSNRGRQNVASYLVHQLKQDWRKGAAWFESLLVDYDVTSNYGNWMYAAGVGNDPRDRIFNTQKQARNYDPNGDFRALWLDDGRTDPKAFLKKYF